MLDSAGQLLAAISIAGFTDSFLDGVQRKIIMTELDDVARVICQRMGFDGEWGTDLTRFLANITETRECGRQ